MLLGPRVDYPFRTPIMFFAVDGEEEGGGGGGQDWKDVLSDDLKVEASLADFTDVPALAKAFVDTKAMVGSSFRVPGDEAGKEDWDKFHSKIMDKVPSLMFKPDTSDTDAMGKAYSAMGMPEKVDGYVSPEIDSKGIEMSTEFVDAFKETAHENGLNQKQFEGVVQTIVADSVKVMQTQQATMDADTKKLVDTWGAAYDNNLKIALAIAKKVDAPAYITAPLESPNPPFATAVFMHSLAERLGVETSEIIKHPKGGPIMTPEDASLTMSEMRRNPEHPLNRPSDPGHRAALKKFTELAVFAHPT